MFLGNDSARSCRKMENVREFLQERLTSVELLPVAVVWEGVGSSCPGVGVRGAAGVCPATRRGPGRLLGKRAFLPHFQMGESALPTHRASAESKGKFSCRVILT